MRWHRCYIPKRNQTKTRNTNIKDVSKKGENQVPRLSSPYDGKASVILLLAQFRWIEEKGR